MKTALPPKLSPPEPEPVQAWARRESSPPLPAQEHRSPCFQVEPDAPMAEHQADAEHRLRWLAFIRHDAVSFLDW